MPSAMSFANDGGPVQLPNTGSEIDNQATLAKNVAPQQDAVVSRFEMWRGGEIMYQPPDGFWERYRAGELRDVFGFTIRPCDWDKFL